MSFDNDNTPRVLSATSINGTNVKNTKGDSIGEIKDLMIDWNKGRVEYAVLSFGGFLGMGDKLFAVPLEAFTFDSVDSEEAVIDMNKESLDNAPGFDKDNWPKSADHEFTKSVYSHYNMEYEY